MSILLDLYKVATGSYSLVEERDQAVEDYACAEAGRLQAQRHKKKLFEEMAQIALQLEDALKANLHLQAQIAALDPTADNVRRAAWMTWTEKLCDKANEQADLAGKRVLALEAYVARTGGDRDVIYGEAGLSTIAEPRATSTTEEA